VPVLDGYTLNRVGGRSPRGGDWLDEQVTAWLAGKQLSVKGSAACVGLEAAPPTYRAFQERRVVRDLKEGCCLVPQPPTEDGAALDVPEGGEEPCYELPDGTKVMPEPALVRIPGGCRALLWVGLLCFALVGWADELGGGLQMMEIMETDAPFSAAPLHVYTHQNC
jgi:hypothetical protein